MRNTFVVMLAVIAFSQSVQAQRAEQLQQGMKVRVTDTGGTKTLGTLVTGDRESVTISPNAAPDAPYTIAQSNLKRLEVDKGPRRLRGAALGGLMGLGIGAVAGAAIGYFTYSEPEKTPCTPDPEAWGFNCLFANACFMVCSAGDAAAMVGILGGGAGLLTGVVAGAVHGGHYWVKVPLPLTQPAAEKDNAVGGKRGERN